MARLPSYVLVCSFAMSCGKELDFSSTPYEGEATLWFRDADADGYGDPDTSDYKEERPEGYVDNDLDCNDQNIDIHPGMQERCGGGDEDCDQLIDDADPDLVPNRTFWADPDEDGLGDPLAPRTACARPEGFVDNDADCSPEPVSVDWVDGQDDDCDGLVDIQGASVSGRGLGLRWDSDETLHRHLRVGDTTLWLTSDVFLGLAEPPPPEPASSLMVLRDADVDFEAEQLVFDEWVTLGDFGDIALYGDELWVRSVTSLLRVDPTVRGLTPLDAVAEQRVSSFDGFPLAVGDYDGDGAVEVAAVMPSEGHTTCSYPLGAEDLDGLPPVEDRSSLGAHNLLTARFSSQSGDDLVGVSFDGVWVLSPGQWDAPRVVYPYFTEVAVGDIDGDGLDDLALCADDRLEVWLGASFSRTPGEGWLAPDVVTGQLCVDVALADVTGDGRDDLWIGEPDRSVLAPGSAILPSQLQESDWQFVLGVTTYAVSAGDLDGDGHADVGSRGPEGWVWFAGVP